ncbi:MAG: DUF1285 domain-containing protein [Brevundimonas sp.]|uniref:DUF1285 domain-containing protein n=1 Tax=Brevundimonas sp. TaxID=1871086 RepID=UPI002727044E|nr:DUF1285 domain-containing protein [Brevundimonas sp.]MDO9589011.1 DUF1285 domain-containing protein [Brevundimonas sp.]MDP3368567.1 DUF1285 domain-containing protein [Brevundimonas sp.]
MADPADNKTGLAGVTAAAKQAPGRGLPPVHLWHPAHCGEIDIVIRRDGVWMHEGSPIGRAELVRLFSTVLRKDDDGYVLVTPGEKLTIRVEDLPFRAVAVERRGEALVFTTDVGDETEAGNEHPIRVGTDAETGEPAPSVHVRADLWARIARSVFYELVEMAGVEDGRLMVRSGGATFALGPVGAGVE